MRTDDPLNAFLPAQYGQAKIYGPAIKWARFLHAERDPVSRKDWIPASAGMTDM